LNLLVALEAILEERSVSRAAQRLFITQPAMSKTLQRLRVLFDDPLFTRVSHGLVPTPRALELSEQLPSVLNAIKDMVDAPVFDPLQHKGKYIVAAHDVYASYPLIKVMTGLAKQAPNMVLGNPTMATNFDERLATGAYDFCIGLEMPADRQIHVTPLKKIGGVCIVRSGHPLARRRKKITMDDYLKFRHVSFVVRDSKVMGLVDQMLAGIGLQREIAFETNSLFTAARIMLQTDFILSTFDYVAIEYQDDSYKILALPEEFENVKVPLLLMQHERTLSSAPHGWLREKIQAAF
jgi:DNA-binding transcriptional LysR family regulator